jgi:hypothetical protein
MDYIWKLSRYISKRIINIHMLKELITKLKLSVCKTKAPDKLDSLKESKKEKLKDAGK